jgi:CRP-like cAMP-binding protein/Fe-S-cluster-containing hydrogenase component 2
MAVDYFTSLQREVEREVMACIGCNDCLLACPLPDKHFVTIAQLNAGALASHITDPQVIDFVMACTQCQQCVPVCPADLHRADIVLWNKMKVEDVEPDRLMPLQVGPNVFQSGWTLDALSTHLSGLPLFRGVEPGHLRRILLSVTLRRLAPGEVLCREGQFHERLYIVLDGAVEQSTTTIGREQTRILVMGPGSFHGEIAVLGNQEELFTITAVADSIVVEFPKAAVFRLMRESKPFDKTMNELYRRRATWTQAKTHPLLAGFPDRDIETLLHEATFKVYQPGEVVYLEGAPASDLFIVRSGFLKVGVRHGDAERVLQYFREGDVFGGSALFFGGTQQASVTANTRAEVLAIPGHRVRELLGKHPHLQLQLQQEATKAEAIIRDPQVRFPVVDRASSHVLSIEDLLTTGVMQGHEILVIDTSICTNCNNCVDACERRHGYARLDRRGLQLDNLLFPSACRHCEDPVCLMCSVNGIVREPDGEIRIVPDNCIGCGACAARCPYGNIQMHDRTKKFEHSGFSLMSLLGLDRHQEEQEELQQEHHRDLIAVKCDLCAGYPYYACVHACPVGAAFRIDPVSTFGRSDMVIGLEMRKVR